MTVVLPTRILATHLFVAATLSVGSACSGLRPLNIPGYYDTAVDTDDTDGPEPTGNEPLLEDFRVAQAEDDIEVVFVASDDDGDIEGGRFRLTLEGETTGYGIPDDLSDWASGPGKGTVVLAGLANGCNAGSSLQFSGKVVDAAGNSSDEIADSVTVSGSGTDIPDAGDDIESAYELPSGLAAGTTLCGRLTSTGHNADNEYSGDMDWIELQPAASATYTFTLTWPALTADYDIQLYNAETGGSALASSQAEGTVQPESFSYFLSSTKYYLLVVRGWDGPGGDWAVAVE